MNFLDTGEAIEGFPKEAVAGTSFDAPITTFVESKTNTALQEICTMSQMRQKRQWIQVLTFNVDKELKLSPSDSGREEVLRINSLKRCSKCHQSRSRNKDVKLNLSSIKSSKEKYDTHSEIATEEIEESAHKRHFQYCRARDSVTDTNLSVPRQ